MQVVFIHCQQQVETPEILRHELSCPQARDILTARRCGLLAAQIGRPADVVIGCARRIEAQLQMRGLACGKMSRHTFNGWRPTDIPEADEEYLHEPE
jgi:hypothetical protein